MQTFSLTFILLILLIPVLPLPAQTEAVRRLKDISPPDSTYSRLPVQPGSFAWWLRTLPLKPPGSPVMRYNGKIHRSAEDSTVAAVIDLDMRGRKLEQCMDILIRIYTGYMWQQGRTGEISLPLPGNYWLSWLDWKRGIRPRFNGIRVTLYASAEADSSFQNFENYLRLIYSESHTQQFYHNLRKIERRELQIGDILISKGSKSHAVIIADLVRNEQGELLALVGHGDTPACEFYIINYRKDNPWVPVNFELDIIPLPIKRQMKWDGLRRFMER
jgi:hypothetical protein